MEVTIHIGSAEEARIVNRCLLDIAMERDAKELLYEKQRRAEREADRRLLEGGENTVA